jgi:glycosyltransferase involved in cell wall biosynthesis
MEEIVNSLAAFKTADAEEQTLHESAFGFGLQHSLVTVIIPCYNGEAYLQESIESALAQTHSNVEVIVVDDGSTDRTPEIAQRFPVRYIHQPNRGLCASRNVGIRESRGSFVIFLDADDRLKPEAAETGLRVLAERPNCAMAVGDHIFVSENGSHLADSRKDCFSSAHYEELLKSNFIEMISSVLFRRTVLEQVGGFDTNLRVAEDYELYLRIARDYPICCHPAVVAEYRLHQSNASRNSELMLTMTLDVLKSQARHVRGDARRLFAFLEGIRGWRKRYGRHLAKELARSNSPLYSEPLRRKILVLLDHYPQGLIALFCLRAMPRLSKRIPTVCKLAAELPLLTKGTHVLQPSEVQPRTPIGC